MSKNNQKELAQEAEATSTFLERYTGATKKLYELDIIILRRWLSDKKIGLLKVKPLDLERFGTHLVEERKNKPASVARRLTTIRSFYRMSFANGFVPRDPSLTLSIPSIHYDPSNRYGLNQLELSLLIKAAMKRSPQDGALVCLMSVMGLRVTTALSFSVGDLNNEEHGHRVLKYKTKNSKLCVAPIPVPVGRILDLAAEGRSPYSALIVNRQGHRMERNSAYYRLKLIARDAGLPYESIHPHTLRGSAITAALNSGMSLRKVQLFANHADARQTIAYDHDFNNLDQHPAYMLSSMIPV